MILSIDVVEKNFGDKVLYKDLKIEISAHEKVGLIGRNGTGKSTLFKLITGEDKDYAGEITTKRGTVIINSRQEHFDHESDTVMEYIQGDLPEYSKLIDVIDNFDQIKLPSSAQLQAFSDAVERFNQLGYYQLDDDIKQAFEVYQIDSNKIHKQIHELSGGQKRMVELIKVIRSRGDIALIDEPTNHMDYIAKDSFIKWLKSTSEAVLVITHDRDVLSAIDRIIEIRDGRSYNFRGNYSDYLKTNTNQITNQVNEYELSRRRIMNLEEDVIRFKRLKEKARSPGTIRRFKSQELKARAELLELEKISKPSFWIDQESASELNDKITSTYHKHKTKNIKLSTSSKNEVSNSRKLIQVSDLSLGYGDKPLFSNLSFILSEGERLRFNGRNGVGKTTLVKAIMAQANNEPLESKSFSGFIEVEKEIKIGLYEQEISPKYLKLSLNNALEQILDDKNLPINQQKIKQLLSDYLFNPLTDGQMIIERLSGGQKARIQIIAMLLADPQILILDEPTNHLDLPSIEELENALKSYAGSIIYISHDSFFAKNIGGQTINIDNLE